MRVDQSCWIKGKSKAEITKIKR